MRPVPFALALVSSVALAGDPPIGWRHTPDGGSMVEGDYVTDLLAVRVGETVEVAFGRPLVTSICDDQALIKIAGPKQTLLVTGVKEGQTKCGFWFDAEGSPHPVFQVTVLPAAPKKKR